LRQTLPGGPARLNPRARRVRGRVFPFAFRKEYPMQDLLWIAAMAGLVAATLAYVRLCDNA